MPAWLDALRQTILFLLGVAVILDAVISPGTNAATLAAGLVLVGLAPLDRYLTRRAGP